MSPPAPTYTLPTGRLPQWIIPTPRKCGSDFSRTSRGLLAIQNCGCGVVQVQRGVSLWTCGSNFPPTRNLEADRPIFSPVEVWVKLPATGNSEDGADTVLHNSAETAWLSILTTFAQG